MKLNHLNLPVGNVKESASFLTKYFGLEPFAVEPNDTIALLRDDDGMIVNISHFGKANAVAYPAAFHIGFMQESEARVNEINAQLKEDGFDVGSPKRFHWAWTFYLKAPGGFLVEVFHQPGATEGFVAGSF